MSYLQPHLKSCLTQAKSHQSSNSWERLEHQVLMKWSGRGGESVLESRIELLTQYNWDFCSIELVQRWGSDLIRLRIFSLYLLQESFTEDQNFIPINIMPNFRLKCTLMTDNCYEQGFSASKCSIFTCPVSSVSPRNFRESGWRAHCMTRTNKLLNWWEKVICVTIILQSWKWE